MAQEALGGVLQEPWCRAVLQRAHGVQAVQHQPPSPNQHVHPPELLQVAGQSSYAPLTMLT